MFFVDLDYDVHVFYKLKAWIMKLRRRNPTSHGMSFRDQCCGYASPHHITDMLCIIVGLLYKEMLLVLFANATAPQNFDICGCRCYCSKS